VRCLRKKHYMSDSVLGAAIEWFNALCVDDADMPAFRAWQQMVDPTGAAAMAAEDAEAAAAERDIAARAAAVAAARQAGDGPDDFWALQQVRGRVGLLLAVETEQSKGFHQPLMRFYGSALNAGVLQRA
jgi:hypothetical protein